MHRASQMRHRAAKGSHVLTVIAIALLPIPALANASAPNEAPAPRVLHFPNDRSLGTLRLSDSAYTPGKPLGPAQGNVTIPAGKEVDLTISDPTPEDLAALENLRPSDLCGLRIRSKTFSDNDIKPISHLTGLQWLTIGGHVGNPRNIQPCPFTGAGLQHLKDMDRLRILHMRSCRITDANLQHLTDLPALELLMISHSPHLKGSGLSDLRKCPKLKRLDFYFTPLGDRALDHLADIDQLEQLSLQYADVTEKGLARLRRLRHLRHLTLSDVPLTDAGMRHIAALTGLEYLQFECNGVTDQALALLRHLSNLHVLKIGFNRLTRAKVIALQALPNLDQLTLYLKQLDDNDAQLLNELPCLVVGLALESQWITDKGLPALGRLKGLERLNLKGMPITDEGLSHIAGMTALKNLDLEGTKITDAGLAHLSHLTALHWLSLKHTQVTGTGLSHLKDLPLPNLLLDHCPVENAAVPDLIAMPSLQRLGIQRTYIDEQHVEELKEALPDCRVFWEVPPVRIDAPAPPLTIDKFVRAPVDTVATWDALRGNVVVLEFWATWCGACVAALPHVNELIDHFEGQPVRFISITDESEDIVKGFLTDHTLKSWIASDPDGSMSQAYRITRIPRCIVVDPNGIVRTRTHPNNLTPQTIQTLLDN